MLFKEQVKSRVEMILAGTPRDEIRGATSVRCAVGLVINNLDGITTLNEAEAWDYIDRNNHLTVIDLRNEFMDRVAQYWRQL